MAARYCPDRFPSGIDITRSPVGIVKLVIHLAITAPHENIEPTRSPGNSGRRINKLPTRYSAYRFPRSIDVAWAPVAIVKLVAHCAIEDVQPVRAPCGNGRRVAWGVEERHLRIAVPVIFSGFNRVLRHRAPGET